jgi:hypothetical protein
MTTSPDILRLLRIATSAVFGVLFVLLIVLWVRSYEWYDDFWLSPPLSRDVGITSEIGCVSFSVFKPDLTRPIPFGWSSLDIDAMAPRIINFGMACTADYAQIEAPIWLPVVVTAALTAAPWLPWSNRFLPARSATRHDAACRCTGLVVAIR